MNMCKYAAIVVLYNPNDEVLTNIDSYIEEIEQLYVLDNSTQYNQKLIDKIKENSKCKYMSMNGNKGLAGALNIGCHMAYEQGFDYILTMDQDSCFKEGAVSRLIEKAEQGTEKLGIVAPNVTSVYPDAQTGERKVAYVLQEETGEYDQTWVMTSGSLMNLAAFEEVGGFDEDFFIAHIDVDFGIRLTLAGYETKMLGDAMIYQRFGHSMPKKILWKTVYPWYEAPERTYYLFRNHTYMMKKYGKKIKPLVHVSLANHLIKILLFENKKWQKVKCAWLGYMDGRRGKMGKWCLDKFRV